MEMPELDEKTKELREFFQGSLFEFAKYINPTYMYGDVHETIFGWLSDPESGRNQLLLIPRGHLKSHCIAVWVVWTITKEPWTSIIYLSGNATLCEVQLAAIKGMLTSKQYRKLWPEMLEEKKSLRDKWTGNEFNVDHPMRAAMGTRDYTVAIRTIGSANTGLHCDYLVGDDIVTDTNAYTQAGRDEVKNGFGAFVGIKNADAKTKVVGTRYHPADIYNDFLESETPVLDEEGNIIGTMPSWEVVQAVVEDSGRGNGNFLWPKTKSPVTGKWYGFDTKTLAEKKSDYISLGRSAWFWSQYYNEPNDPGSNRVDEESFLYFNPDKLIRIGRSWYYDNKKLFIAAGMDVAFSEEGNKQADYSALAVTGMDWEGFVYILALIQYKTLNSATHYKNVIDLYEKWHWSVLKIETNNGGKLIDKEIKKNLRMNGKTMKIISKAKGKEDGTKLERYAITLEPRYEQGVIYHHRGGLMSEYEEQLKKARPKHDDLKDAVCDAIEELELPPATLGTMSVAQGQVVAGEYGGRRRVRRSN